MASKLKPETQVLVNTAKWIKLQYPRIYPHIVKIDNEGKRSMTGHIVAKRAGLNEGASDWLIAYPIGIYHGMWIEFKKEDWKGPSGAKEKEHHANQINFLRRMSLKGYHTAFCVGFNQGREAIAGYIKGEASLYQSVWYKPIKMIQLPTD